MDRETLRQYSPAITRAVNDLVRDMAGSISAEHGIGIDKIDELAHYRSKVELDTMRSLKRALDPKNIMNPGKILRLDDAVRHPERRRKGSHSRVAELRCQVPPLASRSQGRQEAE